MTDIMYLRRYWGYTKERCEGCKYLEKSAYKEPDESDRLFACDAPNGICIKDGKQVYNFD